MTLACLGAAAPSALASATATPELISPAASSASTTPLAIEYRLPEPGTDATLTFSRSDGTGTPIKIVLTAAAASAGLHHFKLNLHELTSEGTNVASATASSVPDGEYGVTLGYEDLAHDPEATAAATKVTLATVTVAPVLSGPSSGQTFRGQPFTIDYALPEAAEPGTVEAVLIGPEAEVQRVVLSETEAGAHAVVIEPSDPATRAGVASAPAQIPADEYELFLSYQDALGNPVAFSEGVAVTIAYPLCEVGTYSTTGEEPCLKAPKGFFVATQGQTQATECLAGHYAPEPGMNECLPAEPGNYVPAAGSSYEFECEQGTYADRTGLSACEPVPAGHYAPRGAFEPTPCAPGTYDPHTSSPAAEFCELDAPGYFSSEGAAQATACEPGTFAAGSGSRACTPAAPGSFVAGSGAAASVSCPAGTFSASERATTCTTTPAGSYSGAGASEAIPCPAGTSSGPGASSCAAVGAPVSVTASTPQIESAAPSPAALTLKATAAAHQASLRRTSHQQLTVTCSVPATVLVRVTATIRLHHTHLAIRARPVSLRCAAGTPRRAVVAFKLTTAARSLLARRGASVTLTVAVAASGSSAAPTVSSITGRP